MWKLKTHWVDPAAAVKGHGLILKNGDLKFPPLSATCGPLADWQLYSIDRKKVTCGHCLNKIKKAWQVALGVDRLDRARPGLARRGRRGGSRIGMAGFGLVRHSRRGEVPPGMGRLCLARIGMAGGDRPPPAGRGQAGIGTAVKG
jgi:hypothetical protein